jgi:hypothetical protein
MNIFVLNSGRCGSTTFIQACSHIQNYSCGHESRITQLGSMRMAYPLRHIEADNRLSWLLGRLDRVYGNDAYYVHLMRDSEAVIASFERRYSFGIMQAYREGILLGGEPGQSSREQAVDYLDTIESNIRLFLKDKSHWMPFRLEMAKADFAQFWEWIGAKGDLELALAAWDIKYNAS